jgi:hypothetical protein
MGVFGFQVLIRSHVTANVLMAFRRTKCNLIIKLIASQDESNELN